ncbi:DUF294 nucleotidyltransferase-like domain-containing protein [Mobilicoccus sp.]|uniref:DUF294 nucleotidyltransferase-like domain-containing protein n=1 Tax=Mobilicoccus sp. TaxID=2034349 RepID=UPI0028A2BCA5|nr:DUF294 nucleotidyltransferase-like domain-containing protein [Mobilicoccus sp.]
MEPELAEVRDFFAAHEPFSQLPAAVLDALPARCTMRYHRRGTTVLDPDGAVEALYVVRSGAVDVYDRVGGLVERVDVGGSVGVTGLLEAPPYGFLVTAVEDTLMLAVPRAAFEELLDHGPVASYFLLQQAHRLRAAVETVSVADHGGAVLRTKVSDMVSGRIITVDPRRTVQEAAALMREENISSLLVLDDEGHLAGILTDSDLRARVVATALPVTSTVAEVMTPEPLTLPSDALAFEALLEMLGRDIHHLPVIDPDGRPLGLVTNTDLVRLERSSPLYLVQDVGRQRTTAGLANVAARIPSIVDLLVTQDASAGDISRVISALADAIHRRLIALAEAQFGPAPAPYCWVVLGSQARYESGLGGDQDTAIILEDSVTPEQADWFADFAGFVTDGLVECGFPRCPGDVMATNPRWRQTESAWRGIFAEWLDRPTPDALVGAAIFFDMRPLTGDPELCERLRRYVLSRTPEARPFLAHLTKQAVAHQPPIGLFRGLVVEKSGPEKSTLDIKHRGVGPVCEIARVLALSIGSPAVDTRSRLQAASAAGAMGSSAAEDLLDAFEFISYVRLRHQAQRVREGAPPDNNVAPDTLGHFEKRTLKDAFGVVRSAQGVLGGRQPLGYMS